MRIAYVTETWLPSTDGVITRMLATIGELAKLGHEILVIAPESGPHEAPDVTVRTVPTISFRFVYGGKPWGLPLPRVARYLDEFRPDVVHLLNPVLVGWAGAYAVRRRGYPTVASYHTDLSRYARDYKLSWIVPLLRSHTRKLHSVAQVNLATSSTGQRQLTDHGISGCRLWPAGVDLDTYRPAEDGETRRTGRPTALFVGRVAAEKELHHLAPLTDRTSPYALTIVGDGPALTNLKGRFGRTVSFTGRLSGDELARSYRSADVFVFPSTTETLGLVLLEALASGLPIVAFDSPASRDLLSGCAAARLVPAGRTDRLIPAIDDLLGSMPREELCRAARNHVQNKTWEEATATLLDHYLAAIGTTGSTAPVRIDRPRRKVPTPVV